MSDYSKLKVLAEDTKGWDNLKDCWPEETEDGDLEVNWFVGAVNDGDDKYPVLEVNTAQYDALEDAGRLARFYAAANPAAVLGLIAEIERLSDELSACTTSPGGCGYWREAAKLREQERDALKTENSDYKSGQERYEDLCESQRIEVRALKAECEGLRKHAPHPEIIWCDCGDGHHANSYGAGFMDANDGVCENCDAASGGFDLRKDAERYRWLRDSGWSDLRDLALVGTNGMDGFVDAALSNGEQS